MWGGIVHSSLKASHFFITLLQGVTGMDGQPGPKGNVVSPGGHMIWLVVVVCGHSPCLAVGNWGRRVGTLASDPQPGAALWWQKPLVS